MNIHVGTSGYGYKEWKGRFYPETISPKEMLHFYSAHLGAVEINNTFYHMPVEGVLKSWADQVPGSFLFAVKAPQVITHRKRLKNVDEEMAYLFKALPFLGAKLGPVLFQFPANFRMNLPLLNHFLTLIPDGLACAFEFRSPAPLHPEAADLLRERGHSLCIADTDERPAGEIESKSPWGYLRLRRPDYTDADLARWLAMVRSQPWQRAFIFFKHEEKARGPETAMRFRELIDTKQEGS
jgi:uncharacterized protein YecE (DUF72 family)